MLGGTLVIYIHGVDYGGPKGCILLEHLTPNTLQVKAMEPGELYKLSQT